MDPEIAALMGITPSDDPSPDFSSLFNDSSSKSAAPEKGGADQVDITKKAFDAIEKLQEDPKPWFKDKDFYKKVLVGEGEESKRVHSLLSKFLNTEDPKDRSIFRGKLISAYWNLASNIASKIQGNIPLPKLLLLRFGILLPTLISQEQRTLLSTIIFDNDSCREPVYYADEWLKKVAAGQIGPSATDEVKVSKKNPGTALQSQIEKARGNQDIQIGMIRKRTTELEYKETQIKEKALLITKHSCNDSLFGLQNPYAENQKKALGELGVLAKECGALNKEINGFFADLGTATENLKILEEKLSNIDGGAADNESALAEFNTVRQMVKLNIGRQGNHIPILMKQYFKASIRDIATRENVINCLDKIEKIDSGVFQRTFKRQTNRIVPFVLLLPSYGEKGVCWEPFEKFNRATSRGRIAIPLYPKNFTAAVTMALGDLRWQVAKEKAQHYWMEEGLTGRYYQWFSEKKIRGDVKEYFIQDYLLWISKESEGMQKLEKDVRGIFWRYIPFPQEIKDNLKNRGFVYGELYKKDMNRAKSDGY